jgi:hypothetical protein
MEDRLNSLEAKTNWLMQVHTTGLLVFAGIIATYFILKNK